MELSDHNCEEATDLADQTTQSKFGSVAELQQGNQCDQKTTEVQ